MGFHCIGIVEPEIIKTKIVKNQYYPKKNHEITMQSIEDMDKDEIDLELF